MRRMIDFICAGDQLAGTLDDAAGKTGLLIVSGGNEIRSGAYAGQAAMAQHFAGLGYPVFRFDRRGVGDSEGMNEGFEGSADDLAATVAAFREHAPQMERLVAFGNCDAATALAMFHSGLSIGTLILANPWVIELATDDDAPTPPSSAAIRSRYLARLKNPRSLIDLFTGKIDLGKLIGGLKKAVQKEEASGLAQRLASALGDSKCRTHLLIAERDTTALAFMASWKSALFDAARQAGHIQVNSFDTASHSFADAAAKLWLYARITEVLAEPD
jgi:exosortase A-associated hydrolase 1